MPEALLVEQPELNGDLDRLTEALTAAFAEAKGAVLDDRSVVFLLDDRDLLGQRGVVEAALATGILGLMRALALEGARPGWRLNAVSGRGEEDVEQVWASARWLAESTLSGQLIRVGTAQIGKVCP